MSWINCGRCSKDTCCCGCPISPSFEENTAEDEDSQNIHQEF
jgi:hypothetical protein